ncbi:MAG TPA: biotin/lipoyl-containing protein, partial [Trueperaceae bacterium]|nr:biotin/lipoyl-containing protein [Trueperaceae bacterium]
MARELLLPELAESVVEGEIIKWLVNEGDFVTEDQPVVEVMTDKVTVELPSPYAGVLQKRMAAEGDVVKVHEVIALFSDAGEGSQPTTASQLPAAPSAPESAQAQEERSLVEGGAVAEDDGEGLSLFKPGDKLGDDQLITIKRSGTAPSATPAGVRGPYGRVLAVPAARRLAREMNVDIEGVAGSGPNGRVRVDDVRQHAEQGAATAPTGGAQREVRGYQSPVGFADLEERVPVRGLRRIIAGQMVASHLQAVRTLH